MIVKIDKLSHDFKGIAKCSGKVVFVDKALPNEIVDIKIIKEKKNLNEGKIISLIQTNPDRINSPCPYYDVCGGCDIGHIKYEKSLEYKKEIVKDIIKRYANIDTNPQIIPSTRIYEYRNKITLKVQNNKLALVKKQSNELVAINKCLLVDEETNNIIQKINKLDLSEVDEVVIRSGKEKMVIIKGNVDIKEITSHLQSKVDSIILNNKVIYGKENILINVGQYQYLVYPESFFQINTDMIEKLYNKVKEYSGSEESLLDLYCGAGTIGIFLAENFNTIRGIEINKDAIKSANLNKEINQVNNISFECKSVSQIDKITENVVIVDPPRSGLDKITTDKIISSSPSKIVYVSCNPITLARDLNILKEKYFVEDITLFDMFPNTSHVECVCLLKVRQDFIK